MVHSFTAILLEKKMLTEDILYFSLSCPEEFSFEAGQFVTFFLTQEGKQKPRSYSILNPPSRKGKLEFITKLIPGGLASEFLEKAKLGDPLPVKGPLGHLLLQPAQEHWFIATGTGVVPFYSMLAEHLPRLPDQKFNLLLGLAEQKDIFLQQELELLQKNYTSFTYVIALSREAWSGARGRVQEHLPADLGNKMFYLCGRQEMIVELKAHLLAQGVPVERIKLESYG